MQTFRVSDVRREDGLLAAISVNHAIAQRIAEPLGMEQMFERFRSSERRHRAPPPALEAWGCNHDLVVAPHFDPPAHPLIEAVHTAFAEHYPLTLSPDDVWLCLAQGFALHVEANAEGLRSRFVRHQGGSRSRSSAMTS
jgi:hypothetical protein